MILDTTALSRMSTKVLKGAFEKAKKDEAGEDEQECNIIESFQKIGLNDIEMVLKMLSSLDDTKIVEITSEIVYVKMKEMGATDQQVLLIQSLEKEPKAGHVIITFELPLKKEINKLELQNALSEFNDLLKSCGGKGGVTLPQTKVEIEITEENVINNPEVIFPMLARAMDMNIGCKIVNIEFKKG
jgi:hypothetical protein